MIKSKCLKSKLSIAISTALITASLATTTTLYAEEKKNEKPNNKESIEVIVVKGSIAASYEGAIGIKRLADTVVDAITTEDIGQFADDSIAGAIKRMPGVQIETDPAGTDGDRVSIRGLGPQFVNSTINGRTLLSSGNEAQGLRKMNFNVFPASILSGVRVVKGQTAIRPESGLAGQVNLLTIRPLDLKQLHSKNYFGSISYKTEYHDLDSDKGGSLEGVFAWRNDAKTLGMYAGAVSADSDLTYEQSGQRLYTRNLRVDNDGDGVQDELIKGVTVPNSSTNRPIKNNKSRTAYSAGIQWQPDDSIDLVWDITSTTYDSSSQRHNGQLITNPIWGRTVFDKDAIEIDDNNVLRYADFGKTTGGGGILSRVQDMRFNNDTANLITGINLDWALDNLTTNFDIYYSTVDYSQDLRFPIFNRVLNKNNVVYDSTGNLPTFTTGDDRLDPSGYRYLFSNIREIELDGENYGSTLKFNYLLDTNWLSSFDVGFHYEKTDLDSKRSTVNRLANPSMADEIVDLALTGELTDGEFLSGHDYSPGTWLISDFDTIGELDPRVLTTGIDNLGVDYSASHESTEQIFAAFGQLNLDVYFSDMQLTGNLGVRAVYTKNEATAGTLSNDPAVELNTISNDYWEYLPSLNLNLGMTESTALRLGVSKTLSRPEYSDMAPIIRINIPNCEPNDTAEDCKGTGKSGNPDLEPMTAWNYDLTFEYYNETDGSAVVSLFYKSLKNFIIDDIVFDQTIIGQPEDILFDVTKPVNFSDGEVKGYEIGFYQPFDKLIPALAGFGMSTNYTYVDSSFDEDVGNSGFGFPGTSKNNLNFVGFYENDVFSARVAYLFRDDFFRSLAGQGSQTTDARFTGDTQSLDLNIKIKPTQNLVLALNARNLLDDTRRDHIGDEAKMLDFFDVGRHYSMSITYRF